MFKMNSTAVTINFRINDIKTKPNQTKQQTLSELITTNYRNNIASDTI